MSILVTGGAGFIGSSIVDKLIAINKDVVIVDDLSTGNENYINPEAEFYRVDIADSKLKRVFVDSNITHVIHCAAQISVQSSLEDQLGDARSNIMGTINLLENCRKYDVEKIIYSSSAAVYGEPEYLPVDEKQSAVPVSPYGLSKYTPEQYIQLNSKLFDIKYTILRYSNVYGPRQSLGEGGVIRIFIDRMLNSKRPIVFGDGKQTRDFIYIDDIIQANIEALSRGDNQIFNISCNKKNSVNDLYQFLNKILGQTLQPIYKKERQGDIKHSFLDNAKARRLLGWEPDVELIEGLEKTIKYYLKKKDLKETAFTLEELE